MEKDIKQHTVSVLVENKFGALARIAGLFSGRGYNIESLTVNHTHDPNLSRMTIVTRGDDDVLEQIEKKRGVRPVHFARELTVRRYSILEGMPLKDVLLPEGCAVKGLVRDGGACAPSADTLLRDGDVLSFEAETPDPAGCEREVCLLTGNPPPQTEKEGDDRKAAGQT